MGLNCSQAGEDKLGDKGGQARTLAGQPQARTFPWKAIQEARGSDHSKGSKSQTGVDTG